MSRQVKPTLDPVQSDEPQEAPPRRRFIGATSSLVVGGALTGLSAQAEAADLWSRGNGHGSLDESLKARTLRLRTERAIANHQVPLPRHQDNDDEERYPNPIGTDTRGLPHNARGEVDLAAWATLKQAVTTRTAADFEKVKLGGTRKLVNPLGTLGLNLTGLASNQIAVPSAPALASAERASDAVEIYWQSLLREVPFHEYRADTGNALLRAAAAEISQLPGYVGPRNAAGQVTPDLLFRGTARYVDRSDGSGRTARTVVPPGVAIGPYISQFLLLDVPYGVSFASALIRTQTPANEFLNQHAEWLAIQNGQNPTRSVAFDNTLRYLSTGRDLAEVARGSAGAGAALQILSTARSSNPLRVGGIGAALSPTNPYLQTVTTSASAAGSFAAAYLQGLLPLGVSRGIRSGLLAQVVRSPHAAPRGLWWPCPPAAGQPGDLPAARQHPAVRSGVSQQAKERHLPALARLPRRRADPQLLPGRRIGERGSAGDLAQSLLRREHADPQPGATRPARCDQADPLHRPHPHGRR